MTTLRKHAIAPKPLPRRFHQARWDEPIIFELSVPGARGVLIPEVEDGISDCGFANHVVPAWDGHETRRRNQNGSMISPRFEVLSLFIQRPVS